MEIKLSSTVILNTLKTYQKSKLNKMKGKNHMIISKDTGKAFDRIQHSFIIKMLSWASLVAQWLRICLPMQGTRVRALVWEDPTCHGATGPVSHNY